eukprot:Skav203208  [mRNA]  locus=scaffold1148:79133:84034:- [translate_table: standard]
MIKRQDLPRVMSWFLASEIGFRACGDALGNITDEARVLVKEIFADVKTSLAMDEIGGDKASSHQLGGNEWYLFHGTNPDAAAAICKSDFKVSRAGSSTGTLYGKGQFLPSQSAQADEYAKPNSEGRYAVLLCRIIGGHVNYTDEVTPDPAFSLVLSFEALVHSCIEGPYDTVCGDREKTRGTYRQVEFVLFDSEDVYVEYVQFSVAVFQVFVCRRQWILSAVKT